MSNSEHTPGLDRERYERQQRNAESELNEINEKLEMLKSARESLPPSDNEPDQIQELASQKEALERKIVDIQQRLDVN